jgi:hypothetical protein
VKVALCFACPSVPHLHRAIHTGRIQQGHLGVPHHLGDGVLNVGNTKQQPRENNEAQTRRMSDTVERSTAALRAMVQNLVLTSSPAAYLMTNERLPNIAFLYVPHNDVPIMTSCRGVRMSMWSATRKSAHTHAHSLTDIHTHTPIYIYIHTCTYSLTHSHIHA